MEQIIQGKELERYLPHRGTNILIDKVTRQENSATLELFNATNTEGRSLFIEKENEKSYYSPYLFAEFLALGSIVLLDKLPSNHIALFSSISNFTTSVPYSAEKTLHATTERQKDRGPLKRFSGVLMNDEKQKIGNCDIAAYTVQIKENQQGEKKRTHIPNITTQEKIPPEVFHWKNANMKYVDTITSFQTEPYALTTQYTYPTDHPFTKGHFPNNPIMMGITQWIMAADTLYALLWHSRSSLPPTQYHASANAIICKKDGTIVCEIKQLTCSIHLDMITQTNSGYPQLLSTKKIVFRDIVRPNETIYCQLNNVNIKPLFRNQ